MEYSILYYCVAQYILDTPDYSWTKLWDMFEQHRLPYVLLGHEPIYTYESFYTACRDACGTMTREQAYAYVTNGVYN